MDRSPAAIARTGGRLAAALLPLAALAVMHALPSTMQGTPLPWVAPGIAAAAAATAGLALLVAVAAALGGGRVRDVGDATGLGMLAVALAVVALGSAADLGLGIGVASAAVAFVAASLAGGRSFRSRSGRAMGVVVVVVLVEACLAAILLAGAVTGDPMAPILLMGAAILLAIAAITALDEPARATALGIAASAVLAMALAGTDNERLIGAAGIGVAAVVAGWSLVVHRLRRAPVVQPAPLPDAALQPEFDELSRLTRELRATIDDLVAARRTIELQRAEIERATTIDPLTGLRGRGPTLERLRIDAAEARRYAHPVALVLLDIDRFAELNHEHGLQVGDTILREVALRLRLRIREADALGRIGGDAFLAILPHTDEGGAATFAQAILDRLLERRFSTDQGELMMTVSIGIAIMRPGMILSGEELLAAAEEALASAKATGGNRIAFDRLHGLARLDERRSADGSAAGEPADTSTPDEVGA